MFTPRMARLIARRLPFLGATLCGLALVVSTIPAAGQTILKRLSAANEHLELTVNSSRILTLDSKIPRAQVNNPEVLTVTPLSPHEIQISAQKPGVTQLNLWDENDKIYTVDVTVYGDVAELEATLKRLFPHASVKAFRISNSLVLTGFVDQPSSVSTIMRLAEDYAPKIINHISVGGVQQILLNVQIMEVSRTKLRELGFDFANINGNDFVVSSISGLISASSFDGTGGSVTAGSDTVRFGIIDGYNSFFGFLKALRQHDLMKILAEPKLVTVSGRPASFNVGGEFPVLVPQSLGTVSIEYKKFGTQVDFMPLVLGNGNIRLEVRPRVSEIDSTRNVVIDDFTIPGLRVREVDTAVEMKAGQTFALAGLIQNRVEAQNKGLPLLSEVPWLGAAFRSVSHVNNEIELLIMVRPEFVDPLEPHEVPPCGPGTFTKDPSDSELYLKGFLEVPNCHGCSPVGCPPSGLPPAGYAPAEEVVPTPAEPAIPPVPQAGVMWQKRQVRQESSRRGEAAASVHVSRNQSTRRAAPKGAPAVRHQVVPAAAQHQAVILPAENRAYPPVDATTSAPSAEGRSAGGPGLIGPVGYDVLK